MATPMTKSYKGYTISKCYCGYPEMRWMVYWGMDYLATRRTLADAKAFVRELEEIFNDPLLADVKPLKTRKECAQLC